MNRHSILGISAIAALGLAVISGSAVAQQKSLKEQLVGAWTLVSTADIRADGSRFERFGQNPKGLLLFDANGRYSLTIVRADLPKFAANSADRGSADENRAVMQGMVAHFGTYSINEADKSITTHIEGSWFPNQSGGGQKRIITVLTADELKYTNPASSFGTTAEVIWQRAK